MQGNGTGSANGWPVNTIPVPSDFLQQQSWVLCNKIATIYNSWKHTFKQLTDKKKERKSRIVLWFMHLRNNIVLWEIYVKTNK